MNLPFFHPQNVTDMVAWRGGQPIARQRFFADAAALAARLPARRYVLNHCEDRYHFLVGLAAALLRTQVSLYPPNRAPQTLAQLAADYPDLYCLTDQVGEQGELETFTVDFAQLTGGEAEPAAFSFPGEQLAGIFFTSGSTGVPKAYAKSWRGFVHEAEIAGRSLGLDRRKGGAIIATVPPQHMYGFTMSVMLPVQFGYLLGAERPFYPQDVKVVLQACPVAPILVTTPVHVRTFVLDRSVFPRLDFILSSTAPLSRDLAEAAERQFDTSVREVYGSTETGAIAQRRQLDDPRWRVFDDVAIKATEDGLQVEAPYFPCAMVLADQVHISEGGRFELLGRSADLIKIAGKRVSLADLNRHLLEIDGVIDGTFFLPEVSGGQEPRLTAFAVAPGKTREEILAALKERIDAVFLPRPLRLLDGLPRNTTGKLPRGNLQRLWEQGA